MLESDQAGDHGPKLSKAHIINLHLLMCVRLSYWPFETPPHKATAAQTNLLATVWRTTLPKAADDKTGRAPHGKLDRETMRQWKELAASRKNGDADQHP